MSDRFQLMAAVSYDPETGLFKWKSGGRRHLKGDLAGSANDRGYWQLYMFGKHYRANRLAWLFVYGEIPKGMLIDHINEDKGDNRISNLRLATKSQNGMNRGSVRTSKTGFKGVYINKKMYMAMISVNGQKHNLGRYKTAQEAHSVYCEAATQLHGEFANFGKTKSIYQPSQGREAS